MTLPKDPDMLYSLVNMKLRDQYPDLESMCDDLNLDRHDLERQLADAGYHYDPSANRFA